MLTVNPQEDDTPGPATTRCHDETPTGDHMWVKRAGRQLQMLPEKEAGRYAAQRPIYADLDFADSRPIPAPPSDMFVVAYAEVGQA